MQPQAGAVYSLIAVFCGTDGNAGFFRNIFRNGFPEIFPFSESWGSLDVVIATLMVTLLKGGELE